MTDQYFAWVDSLQYIFMRNYKTSTITKRISLSHFPTCLSIAQFKNVNLEEEAALYQGNKGKNDLLVTIGTSIGKVLVYRVGEVSSSKLYQSKNGIAYGAISAISVERSGEHLFAASESGEIMTYSLK